MSTQKEHSVSKRAFLLSVILLLTFPLSVGPLLSSAGSINTPYRLVIIAHPDFVSAETAWNLERLRDWHNANDTIVAYIINTTAILTNSSFHVDGFWGDGNYSNPYRRSQEDPILNLGLFNDTQAIIRNYLRYAHCRLNVKYAMLVGDEDKIPTRKLATDGYGAPASATDPIYYENVPTHIYYACLDGTFNDDEDLNTYSNTVSGWGENSTHNNDHDFDEVDWDYEVAIGRITPDSPEELSNIIRKTIAYMETSNQDNRLSKVALAGHHLGFGGAAEWGINFAEQLANRSCSDWSQVTYGFDNSTYAYTFVNAHPLHPDDHLPYLDDTVRSVFNDGIHVWYQCGHGSPTQWHSNGYGDIWDISDVSTLENSFYPLVYGALPCLSGQWDVGDCLSEAFVNDEHGAFASIMNSRYGWGSYNDLHSTSQYIGREFFDSYFNEGYSRLGDMLFDAIRDCDWLRNQSNGAIRWSCFDQNLIGNPAVEMKFPTNPHQPLLGDVDGDSDVDIFDILIIATGYGSNRGDPEYTEACDLDSDSKIDIFDIVIAATHYGESW